MDINLSQNNLKDNRDKKISVDNKNSVTSPLAEDMSDTGIGRQGGRHAYQIRIAKQEMILEV